MPLELDKTTPHKHYESNTITTTSKKLDLDLDNLDVIKVIATALNEYIVIKEGIEGEKMLLKVRRS